MLYEKNTSSIDINNDITAKWIILNSLGEKTQDIVQGGSKTALERSQKIIYKKYEYKENRTKT